MTPQVPNVNSHERPRRVVEHNVDAVWRDALLNEAGHSP
jgi:hypothetical protein